MEFKQNKKKFYAVLVVAMLCACAVAGLAYAAFSAKIVTPGEGEIKMLKLSQAENSGSLEVSLGYNVTWTPEGEIETFDKTTSDVKTVKGEGTASIHYVLYNGTGAQYTIDLGGSVPTNGFFSVKTGHLIDKTKEAILPSGCIDGVQFQIDITSGSTYSLKCTMDANGESETSHISGDAITLENGASADIYVYVISKENWNDPVLQSQISKYGKTSFDVSMTFGQVGPEPSVPTLTLTIPTGKVSPESEIETIIVKTTDFNTATIAVNGANLTLTVNDRQLKNVSIGAYRDLTIASANGDDEYLVSNGFTSTIQSSEVTSNMTIVFSKPTNCGVWVESKAGTAELLKKSVNEESVPVSATTTAKAGEGVGYDSVISFGTVDSCNTAEYESILPKGVSLSAYSIADDGTMNDVTLSTTGSVDFGTGLAVQAIVAPYTPEVATLSITLPDRSEFKKTAQEEWTSVTIAVSSLQVTISVDEKTEKTVDIGEYHILTYTMSGESHEYLVFNKYSRTIQKSELTSSISGVFSAPAKGGVWSLDKDGTATRLYTSTSSGNVNVTGSAATVKIGGGYDTVIKFSENDEFDTSKATTALPDGIVLNGYYITDAGAMESITFETEQETSIGTGKCIQVIVQAAKAETVGVTFSGDSGRDIPVQIPVGSSLHMTVTIVDSKTEVTFSYNDGSEQSIGDVKYTISSATPMIQLSVSTSSDASKYLIRGATTNAFDLGVVTEDVTVTCENESNLSFGILVKTGDDHVFVEIWSDAVNDATAVALKIGTDSNIIVRIGDDETGDHDTGYTKDELSAVDAYCNGSDTPQELYGSLSEEWYPVKVDSANPTSCFIVLTLATP